MSYSLFILLFLIVLAAQLLCCFLVKNKYLRHLPLLLCLFPFVDGLVALTGDSGIFIGANTLVAMVSALVGVACLLGYGLAWAIWAIVQKIKAKE